MNLYSQYTQDELWCIRDIKWAKSLQGIRESQFSLGNGYLCARGIFEEVPLHSQPGTYISGIYDKIGAQVDELVNLPNPINFRLTIEGQKLGLATMDTMAYSRTLNMKKGLLLRETLYRDVHKRRYEYQSLRFISMHQKNIGVLQVAFTPLDADCVIDINTGIDTSVANLPSFSEGKKKHFRIRELGQQNKAGYLVAETYEKRAQIIYWSGFYYQVKKKKVFAKTNVFRLSVKKGQTVVFTKVFCVKHFPRQEQLATNKLQAYKIFNAAFKADFDDLLTKHIHSWERLWNRADVCVEGTANLQRNVRFNIYHMLVCGHYDNGFSSIGARSLSGEGYRGHIFWDADIFLLPFYLFTFPNIAKNMLLYRYRRLEQSRALAKKEGYAGAKFAWESASTGEEETPEWARDIDGRITRVHTHKMEHHITADVAYAVYKYFVATQDNRFMEQYGYEMMFETARFWASRVSYSKKKKKYEILHVIGPDEFHVDVNNNAFTNVMAKWNLLTANKLFGSLKSKKKILNTLKSKLNLKEKEVRDWQKIAARMAVSVNKKRVIEQFDGYFKLKKSILTKTDENGIPFLPTQLSSKNIAKTQLIKQADVFMLFYLLNDVFNVKTKAANYDFYISRTAHKSSLSPSMCSIIACDVGDLNRAYNLFNVALRADISNLHGNTHEGIHAASLGGVWQALVFGFGGISINKENLFINPRMPHSWERLVFTLTWRNCPIKLGLTNDEITLKITSEIKKSMLIGIFDKLLLLQSDKKYTFKRRISERRKEQFY
ncbi:glycoside hydrolase family 65 protein [Candidatus Omnitrophota bacterium]